MSMFEREQLIDKMGRFLTQGLFYETRTEGYQAIFTLKDYDYKVGDNVYLSLKRIYLEIADPTEYRFAIEVFGNWKHWLALCSSKAMMEHISTWREELEIKLASQAIKAIIHTASNEGAKGTVAAKYLAERGWESRATKAKKGKESSIDDHILNSVKDDLDRLGLH